MPKSPGQHLCTEVVRVSQISETHHITPGNRVLHKDQGRNCTDLQTVAQKRALFCVDLAEFCLNVFLSKNAQMLVKDLTALSFLAIEMTNNILRILGYIKKLLKRMFKNLKRQGNYLFLWNLFILSMTLLHPLLFLLLKLLHRFYK